MTAPLLLVDGLTKRFPGAAGPAVDDVSLTVAAEEIVALVGASGSGKTTLARLVLRLLAPDAGSIRFAGDDLLALSGAALRVIRPQLQLVFQEPLAALNPRATVGRQLADPFRLHRLVARAERAAAVAALLKRVGLAAALTARYPHELSGGQRQRVAIARAIASRPRLLVLDEPVSALDISVRAQILNLLMDIQRADGQACLLITHDLAVARAVAERVLVMDRGRIVEAGPTEAVMGEPRSPVTRALLAAAPRVRAWAAPLPRLSREPSATEND